MSLMNCTFTAPAGATRKTKPHAEKPTLPKMVLSELKMAAGLMRSERRHRGQDK